MNSNPIAKANHIPPENNQRTDPRWDWHGIRIVGNSMCQGNSNEDCLKSLAMEFDIPTLKPIDTYNYYSMYFAFLLKFDPDVVTRPEMMDWRNHANFIDFICESNNLPVKVVGYSSIGDRARLQTKTNPADRIEILPFDGKASFLHDLIEETGRILSVGTLVLPDGHWNRIHSSDKEKKEFEDNDPFGRAPYDTPERKKQTVGKVKWSEFEKRKIRRVIALKDKATT